MADHDDERDDRTVDEHEHDDDGTRSDEVDPAVEQSEVVDGYRIRSFPVDDIRVAKTADGRTVEAYAAVFEVPAEVRDRDGHYYEVIDPKAFNRALNRPPFPPGVFYNHGLDLFGKPASGVSIVPLGTSLEVKADRRGVFTRSRYHAGAFADEVLQAVKDGAITGQSFRGAFLRSHPALLPGRRHKPDRDGRLMTVRREEIYPLTEYGPTPTPVYKDAAILAVRSESLQRLRDLISTPAEPVDADDVDSGGDALGAEAGRSAPSLHVIRFQRLRARARKEGIL